MSILELFGIRKDAEPVDIITSGKELRENVEKKNQDIEDLIKKNPDLINNLNQNVIMDPEIAKILKQNEKELTPKPIAMFNDIYNQIKPSGKFGILDLISTGKFALNPSLSPFSLAVGLGGLRSLISNIKNPYKGAFGDLNRQTKAAINREQVRDLQNRIDKGDFGSPTPTPQDDRRGGQYDEGIGSISAGFNQGERGGSQGR